jgi:uncharacterized protein YggE
MKKKWLLVAGLVCVLAIAGVTGCSSGSSLGDATLNINSQQQGIWVSGEGSITVVPDIATLRLGIEAQADSVAVAQEQAQTAMDRVLAELDKNGIAEKDIQVQQFNISKMTRWDNVKGESMVTGYQVTHMVTAKIRNIDDAGTIIDDVANAGGDLTRIDSISFSVENPENYYEQVREKAMADAKAKAKQLADLAGVTLGKATYVSESSYNPPVVTRAAYDTAGGIAPAAAPTTINPGELEVTLDVQVAYAIR